MQSVVSSKKAASMAKCIATMLAIAVVLMSVQPSSSAAGTNAPDADALRFPGRPGSRPRNPVFPGYPRARPSPPMPSGSSSSSSPGVPSSPMPGVPSSSGPGIPAPCTRPVVPGFPGLGGGGMGVGVGGSGSGGGATPSSSPTDCVTPLAALMTCGTFLTGSEPETPTPQSDCCAGLGAFLNSSASAAEGGDDHTLRCLCPVILGDVNKMLPKPMDPVRMMYLPIACGLVLPPQVLYICFTGQQSPPLVGRIPDVWEKPNSSKELMLC